MRSVHTSNVLAEVEAQNVLQVVTEELEVALVEAVKPLDFLQRQLQEVVLQLVPGLTRPGSGDGDVRRGADELQQHSGVFVELLVFAHERVVERAGPAEVEDRLPVLVHGVVQHALLDQVMHELPERHVVPRFQVLLARVLSVLLYYVFTDPHLKKICI